LGYKRILIKMFGNISLVEEFIDNDDDIDYEPYKKLGEEYAELYFKNKYIDNITEKYIAKIIKEFLNSKLSYGIFSNGYCYNIKDKSIPYII